MTLSTVGYGDIMPATPEGKVVATVLILAGIGTFGYAAGMVTTWLRDPDEDEILQKLDSLDRKLAVLLKHLPDGAAPSESPSSGPTEPDTETEAAELDRIANEAQALEADAGWLLRLLRRRGQR